ncbi:hypothetical protein P7C70_g4459, partial [Phenoliferia sp. Uapishka_3]
MAGHPINASLPPPHEHPPQPGPLSSDFSSSFSAELFLLSVLPDGPPPQPDFIAAFEEFASEGATTSTWGLNLRERFDELPSIYNWSALAADYALVQLVLGQASDMPPPLIELPVGLADLQAKKVQTAHWCLPPVSKLLDLMPGRARFCEAPVRFLCAEIQSRNPLCLTGYKGDARIRREYEDGTGMARRKLEIVLLELFWAKEWEVGALLDSIFAKHAVWFEYLYHLARLRDASVALAQPSLVEQLRTVYNGRKTPLQGRIHNINSELRKMRRRDELRRNSRWLQDLRDLEEDANELRRQKHDLEYGLGELLKRLKARQEGEGEGQEIVGFAVLAHVLPFLVVAGNDPFREATFFYLSSSFVLYLPSFHLPAPLDINGFFPVPASNAFEFYAPAGDIARGYTSNVAFAAYMEGTPKSIHKLMGEMINLISAQEFEKRTEIRENTAWSLAEKKRRVDGNRDFYDHLQVSLHTTTAVTTKFMGNTLKYFTSGLRDQATVRLLARVLRNSPLLTPNLPQLMDLVLETRPEQADAGELSVFSLNVLASLGELYAGDDRDVRRSPREPTASSSLGSLSASGSSAPATPATTPFRKYKESSPSKRRYNHGSDEPSSSDAISPPRKRKASRATSPERRRLRSSRVVAKRSALVQQLGKAMNVYSVWLATRLRQEQGLAGSSGAARFAVHSEVVWTQSVALEPSDVREMVREERAARRYAEERQEEERQVSLGLSEVKAGG